MKILFMLLALTSMLCAFQAAQIHPSFRSFSHETLPITSLFAASNGTIILQNNGLGGYTVDVDFANNTQTNTKMLLALYNSWAVFAGPSCLGFKQYYCSQYPTCSVDKTVLQGFILPYIFAQGYVMTTNAYLDYNHWVLNKAATTVLTSTCSSNLNGNYGSGASGLIGLGTNTNGKNNYVGSIDGFSIYPADNNSLKLEFNADLSFKKNTLLSLKADADWRVDSINQIEVGNSTYSNLGYKVIFDINHPSIGLPYDMYKNVIGKLNDAGVTCDSPLLYNVSCSYDKNISDLPSIKVFTNDKDFIEIKPTDYVFNGSALLNQSSAGSFYLSLRALSPNEQGDNYVTTFFNNSIILGNIFITKNYVYFSLKDNSVTFYEKTSDDDNKPDNHTLMWVLIGLGIAVVVILVGVGIYYAAQSKKKKIEPADQYNRLSEQGTEHLAHHVNRASN